MTGNAAVGCDAVCGGSVRACLCLCLCACACACARARVFVRARVRACARQDFGGLVSHAVIAAAGYGGAVRTHNGRRVRVRRPTLEDFVLRMPRAATPIYPKVPPRPYTLPPRPCTPRCRRAHIRLMRTLATPMFPEGP